MSAIADQPSGTRAGEAGEQQHFTRVEASEGWWAAPRLGELWAYRELLWFLTLRDIRIRYKQTLLGAAWAVIQPLCTMLVFSLFFGRLAKVPSDDLPYPIFSFAALVPWTFFSNSLAQSSNSLVTNANLIRKVYFPRIAIPIASILAGVVDFFIAMGVLALMMVFYQVSFRSTSLVTLPLLMLTFITCLGAGLWLASLNVVYRDIRHAVPFLVQFWLFATPVAYPSSLLSEKWQLVFALNPMVGVVEGFRWALLGSGNKPTEMMLVSVGAAILMLVTGFVQFRRLEKSFSDVI